MFNVEVRTLAVYLLAPISNTHHFLTQILDNLWWNQGNLVVFPIHTYQIILHCKGTEPGTSEMQFSSNYRNVYLKKFQIL